MCQPDGTFATSLADLRDRLVTMAATSEAVCIDGLATTRQHWHAPIGDRRTKDRLTDADRAHNRDQAGLHALVEQSIGHLAGAWSLRRWPGLPYRVRAVYRAAAALISLGRRLHRIPA